MSMETLCGSVGTYFTGQPWNTQRFATPLDTGFKNKLHICLATKVRRNRSSLECALSIAKHLIMRVKVNKHHIVRPDQLIKITGPKAVVLT